MLNPKTITTKSNTIARFTMEIEPVSLISFLKIKIDGPKIFWQSENSLISYAGLGIAKIIEANGKDRFTNIRTQAKNLFRSITSIGTELSNSAKPRLFGGFSFFDDMEKSEAWDGFQAASFVLPKYEILKEDEHYWLSINELMSRPSSSKNIEDYEESLSGIIHKIPASGNESIELNGRVNVEDVNKPAERTRWIKGVDQIIDDIHKGKYEKLVLSKSVELNLSAVIDPIDLIKPLTKQYPGCHHFLYDLGLGRAFLGATPELLAKVKDSELSVSALAGSIRRGATQKEDLELGNKLYLSEKERVEHNIVVGQMKAKLINLTDTLSIPNIPQISQFHNIQHLETKIVGRIKPNFDVLDIIKSLHPSPAVGGYPTQNVIETIKNLENYERGWYASPIGWFDEYGNGEFGVGIRSTVVHKEKVYLFSGAGIVADSVPEKEWDETELKLQPIINALTGLEG